MSIPLLSIVIPVFNEEQVLPALHAALHSTLQSAEITFELVFVDDGSTDQTWPMLERMQQEDPRITIARLSRNFGHQVAVSAGLDIARGEAVAVMDADLQDPPAVLLEMIGRWRDGYDVVYGVRTRRHGETAFKRWTATIFYRLIRALTSVDIPADTGDFRLMSRRAVDAFKQSRERHRFVRGMIAWAGFKQTGVRYERARRHSGTTKYPFRKMVAFATDAIVSFSISPLRFATWFGFVVSAVAFAYGLFAIYAKLALSKPLPGWASLTVSMMFLGGVQLVCIGIIGEYVGRIYDESKQRPLYLIQDLVPSAASRAGTPRGT